ncbi:hypothetical protein J7438_15555 [Thalassotalea sp. G20_0]|uniref:hypothetical protein n=1 Tax=Thalassotalea sp. G20_0 TaxID=2821093 RepID=UPI001ADA9775|nr:hypothetical protein [Thalassotalea sp. G20_0]MBO9495494.1 hypothetical protein [Thalassotalea sp. G20_0]
MDSVTVPVSPDATTTPIPSTGEASFRAAKCFGRTVCKMFVAVPYLVFQAFSLGTEALFGAGGGAVGAVRGGTVKLVKAAGAKLGLCEKSTKPLMEYIIKDFYRGTNVGMLPGQIVGAAAVVVAMPLLVHPATLGVCGVIFGAFGIADGVVAYREIKSSGHSETEDNTKNFLKTIRQQNRDFHDFLYGDKKEDTTYKPSNLFPKK